MLNAMVCRIASTIRTNWARNVIGRRWPVCAVIAVMANISVVPVNVLVPLISVMGLYLNTIRTFYENLYFISTKIEYIFFSILLFVYGRLKISSLSRPK